MLQKPKSISIDLGFQILNRVVVTDPNVPATSVHVVCEEGDARLANPKSESYREQQQ